MTDAVSRLPADVLLVDDDDRHAEKLASALARLGMKLSRVTMTSLTFDALEKNDIALVSLVSPTERRLTMLRAIRAASPLPIVAIVAGGRVYDPYGDICSHVDDYVATPWGLAELVSRMHAVYGRRDSSTSSRKSGGRIRAGDVSIDLDRREVTVDGAYVRLTETEYRILSIIARSRGEVCGREELLAQALGRSDESAATALHVHISRIRRKIGRPGILELAPGYRLSPSSSTASTEGVGSDAELSA